MSELIKREDAINAVAELQGIAQSKAELTGISKAWKRIKVLPTVDAVPVVRCGKCANRKYCEHPQKVDSDWFCADGERRS